MINWSKAKKIELIKNVKNYKIKIVGYTIQDLIEVKCDGDSINYNFKILLIYSKPDLF